MVKKDITISGDNWLETSDENVNVEEIIRQIKERVASRCGTTPPDEEKPEAVAETLWKETIGDRVWDIVPRYYVIDWRKPILGPIHAMVRRIINAEIRRYLFPSLVKQSRFNRQTQRALESLSQENVRLRQEVEELRRASQVKL